MPQLPRHDPFDFGAEPLDELFRGFFRPVRVEGTQAPPIRIDVTETGQAYVVRADLPGVKKEEIRITIDGNQVSIGVEARRGPEEREGEKLLRAERYHGKLWRAFSLAQEVDENAAGARLVDGVLELTLPKRSASAAKRIVIE